MSYEIISPKVTASNLTGQTFGRLTVIAPVGRKHKQVQWLCICDCGTEHVTITPSLKKGDTKSCGCLTTDVMKKRMTTHGMTHTPEFRAWLHMKGRCNNPNHKRYKDWGGRGIEYRYESFEDFYADVGDKPSPELSIDRKNNDGHYERGNCRWATAKQQANNRRS